MSVSPSRQRSKARTSPLRLPSKLTAGEGCGTQLAAPVGLSSAICPPPKDSQRPLLRFPGRRLRSRPSTTVSPLTVDDAFRVEVIAASAPGRFADVEPAGVLHQVSID